MAQKSFDYVVIGGGTAGLVVAARLVEISDVTVAVLEAGEDVTDELNVKVPAYGTRNWTKHTDWKFMSTPLDVPNHTPVYLPRGKGLGGSSMFNIMQMGRAPAYEYDVLEKLGCSGWNSDEMLKYFKKSQSIAYDPKIVEILGLKPNPDLYGTGPIINTLPRWRPDAYGPWVKASEELGVPFNASAMGGDNLGAWPCSLAIHPKTANRISSATAYYEPNKNKDNLVVITGAHATRIIFSSIESGEAVAESVEYSKNGSIYMISAKKEVILAAGAFQTPQVLELSGIGDTALLAKHGVSTVIDLPSDHFTTVLVYEHNPEYKLTLDVISDPERDAAEFKLYQEKQEGLLGSLPLSYAFMPRKTLPNEENIVKALQNLKKDDIPKPILSQLHEWVMDDNVPQMEQFLLPFFSPTRARMTPEPGKNYTSFGCAVVHPYARGSIHIKSSDPLAPPEINLSVFDNPVDLAIMVAAVKYTRKLVATEVFKPVVAQEVVPGPSVQTDEEIEEYVRNAVGTTFHPVGTAAMLPRELGGVVDAQLKVYGTRNVRVVDASIIPVQISAHPLATVYAVAEKAADIIKLAMHSEN